MGRDLLETVVVCWVVLVKVEMCFECLNFILF